MIRKSTIGIALVAGALAFAPAMAHAFTGMLISCDPADGVAADATLKPGLSCDSAVNKITIKKVIYDGCTANGAAPWNDWSTAKYPTKKINSAAAATIVATQIDVKAKTFGTCNFSGSTNSFEASGAAKLAYLNSDGKKVGKSSAYVTVGGDLATQSAAAHGLITKGDLAGASVAILVGIDLGNPNNANVLGCNLGAVCPPPIPPSTTLSLLTAASSYLKVGIPDDSDCTAASDPWACCTGAGTGNC